MESITVDDLDQQLAQCLGTDGRASFSAVAAVLGVSDQTVARRYRRLRSAGLLRVAGLQRFEPSGGTNWFLRLRCLPGAGEAIAEALARRDDTRWVQLLSGDTEVLCSLHEVGVGHTESLLTRLPRSRRIVAVSAFSRLHVFTGGGGELTFIDALPAEQLKPLQFPVCSAPPGPVQPEPRPPLSNLDQALFAALAADGRTPYADLATATGWSETRVRRRMDQLRESGALYFWLEIDMPAFGFRNATWLWLSVPPSYLAETGAALARFPEIAFATAASGPANLAACAICRDEESVYEFITGPVGSLPGVERLETSPIIRTLKQASPLMMAGPPAR